MRAAEAPGPLATNDDTPEASSAAAEKPKLAAVAIANSVANIFVFMSNLLLLELSDGLSHPERPVQIDLNGR